MSTLATYLLKDIAKPSLVALFVMIAIIWLMQSLRFMDLIINKGLDIGTFLWITILLVPSLLLVVMPLSLFVGSCFSFRRLNEDHELASLFVAGLPRWRLALPAMSAATLVVISGYALSLWLIPAGMTAFKDMQYDLRQNGGNLLLEEGTFNQMGKDLMVYLKKRTRNNELHSLLVHDNRKENRPVTWIARQGKITFSQEGYPRLTLTEGIRQEVTDDRLSVLEFKKHTIDLMRQIQHQGVRWRDAEERFLGELHETDGLTTQQAHKFRAEYQKRLLWPLTPLPLILIAAVFLIRARVRHKGVFQATLWAALMAIGYHAVLMTTHSFANQGIALALYGQWLIPLGTILICAFILQDFSAPKEEEAENA